MVVVICILAVVAVALYLDEHKKRIAAKRELAEAFVLLEAQDQVMHRMLHDLEACGATKKTSGVLPRRWVS